MLAITASRGSSIASKFLVSNKRLGSHWAKLPLAPADKILGLNEMFNHDSNPTKVNLGVGAYRDESGKPLVLGSVKKAKDILCASSTGHEYAGIAGVPEFIQESIKLAYGTDAEVITSKRVAAVQALSGTGACRLFAEFIAKFHGRGTKVYLPNPTVSRIHLLKLYVYVYIITTISMFFS